MPESKKFSELLDSLLQSVSKEQIESATKVNSEEESDLDKKQDRAFREEDIINKRLLNDNIKNNAILRRKYAGNIFVLTSIWTTAILFICIVQGFCYKNFMLSDKVLIVLITTTTLNIYGFFLIVVKYLFYVEKEKTR